MNHQRFKFYKHSTEYYRQLSNSITHLEETCKDINYIVLPSTINYNRKSKFIKSNSNTNKSHKKVGWVSWFSLSSQSVSCDTVYSSEIPHISWQSHDDML